MKPEHDFSKGKRGALIPQRGKTRISIFIDNAVLDEFRARAEKAGTGYQTMINDALRTHLAEAGRPLTEEGLREVLRQEMPEYLVGLKAKPRVKSATPILREATPKYGAAPGAMALAELCRRYGVKRLALFGSAARGEAGPKSDVDLMVEFEPHSKVSLWDMPKMQAELSALFGGSRVDLVPPEVMKNPFRGKAISKDLRLLYEA
jgi:predicted nucleotidyltransferase